MCFLVRRAGVTPAQAEEAPSSPPIRRPMGAEDAARAKDENKEEEEAEGLMVGSCDECGLDKAAMIPAPPRHAQPPKRALPRQLTR